MVSECLTGLSESGKKLYYLRKFLNNTRAAVCVCVCVCVCYFFYDDKAMALIASYRKVFLHWPLELGKNWLVLVSFVMVGVRYSLRIGFRFGITVSC